MSLKVIYHTHLTRLEGYVRDLEALLVLKNNDELFFFLERSNELKELYFNGLIDNAKSDLKAKKLGTSFDEIKIWIAVNSLLYNVEYIILEDIVPEVQSKLNSTNIFEGLLEEELNPNNQDDIPKLINKFIFITLLNVQALFSCWDKKDYHDISISDFMNFMIKSKSIYFKSPEQLTDFIESNKLKSRLNLIKLLVIPIKSGIKNAMVYSDKL